jgi:hypothetical protein
MSQTAAPQGCKVSAHVSGDPRFIVIRDGILSGFGTNIFTGSPVKMNTDGTIIPVAAVNDPIFGIFGGCEFSALQRRFVLPYFPAGQTYDLNSMRAKVVPINDPGVILIAQTAATVAATARGESINISGGPTGSTFTGLSSQALAAPTGATAGSFTILDIVEQPDNDWGDPFVWLQLMIQNKQGPVA